MNKIYICGIFGSSGRVLVGSYRIFSDINLIKTWIRKNLFLRYQSENIRSLPDSDPNFLSVVRHEHYNLSVHEVETSSADCYAINDLDATSKKINDLTVFFK